MNLPEFRQTILKPLTTWIPSLQSLPIEMAYQSFLESNVAFESATRDNLFSLFKSVYKSADLFTTVFLREVSGKPKTTLNGFLINPQEPLRALPDQDTLLAYCATRYIDQIIAHHDLSFLYTYHGNRLVLLPEFSMFARQDISELMKLKAIYQPVVPELAAMQEPGRLLDLLYYNIPVKTMSKINPDRKRINQLAKNYGCRSLSPAELTQAIDRFAMAAVKVIRSRAK
jgi:hypothetical protein